MAYAICWITATEPETRGVGDLRDLDQLVCRKPLVSTGTRVGLSGGQDRNWRPFMCRGHSIFDGLLCRRGRIGVRECRCCGFAAGKIGSAYLVHKLIDVAENKSFFPVSLDSDVSQLKHVAR